MGGQAVTASEAFEKFGSYLLLDRVAAGGMAEIFIARPASTHAHGRLLVVKRILPSVGADPEFLRMFRSEIEVCLGFNHPNIIQIYDFGDVWRQPYIAMEFIDGKSIRQVLIKLRTLGQHLPPEVAASVAAQAAGGLHYAHTYWNRATGQHLRVIHRDVSPQNLVLSYDGNLKLIDFGIAKAETKAAEITKTGKIKGKASYLAPEQTRPGPIDGRCDIFALGIVLWEMLTGERLFPSQGRSNPEILQKIRQADQWVRPPSVVNPEVPPELEKIVLRALSVNPDDRFATAEDMQKELRTYIMTKHPGFGYSDVGRYLRYWFTAEREAEQVYLKTLNERAQLALVQLQNSRTAAPAPSLPKAPPTPHTLSMQPSGAVEIPVKPAETAPAASEAAPTKAKPPEEIAPPPEQRQHHEPMPISSRESSQRIRAWLAYTMMLTASIGLYELEQRHHYIETAILRANDRADAVNANVPLNAQFYRKRPAERWAAQAPAPAAVPAARTATLELRLARVPNEVMTKIFVNDQLVRTKRAGTSGRLIQELEVPLGETAKLRIENSRAVVWQGRVKLTTKDLAKNRQPTLDIQLKRKR